jgi:hypothetical protein
METNSEKRFELVKEIEARRMMLAIIAGTSRRRDREMSA